MASNCYVCQKDLVPCNMAWTSSYSSALCTIEGELIKRLPCEHTFHSECLSKLYAFTEEYVCPVCSVPHKKDIYIYSLLKATLTRRPKLAMKIYEEKKMDFIVLNYSIMPTRSPLYYAITNKMYDLVLLMLENDFVKRDDLYDFDAKPHIVSKFRKLRERNDLKYTLVMLLCTFYDKKYDNVITKLVKQENFQKDFDTC